MDKGAEWALQKSIYQILVSEISLVEKLGGPRVFDGVPQNTVFPYISLGQMFSRDWSTSTENGLEHRFSLNVWSRSPGKAQTFDIISSIRDALGANPIEMSHHILVNMHCETTEVARKSDGETMHGIMRYRAITEPEYPSK